MRTVHKFLLELGVVNTIKVSPLTRVLLVALDPASTRPAVWVELDSDCLTDRLRLVLYPTGASIIGDGGYPSDMHVGSVIDGASVWHVYERRS